jgi:DNA-binding GntR family transcriptional regulator
MRTETKTCPASSEVLSDLRDADLLHLAPGERLWKLYCFQAADGQATRLRHRIYTKVKADGRLALVTFAVHTPAAGRSVRSNIARVADLPAEALDRIIEAIRAQTRAAEGFEAIDLSHLPDLDAQLAAITPRD